MSVAFWCVLAALLAPYFLSLAARSQDSRAECVKDGLFVMAAFQAKAAA